MILFWVICALLIVIALAFVLPPALQRSDEAEVASDEDRKQANIAVYRDQLSELEADLSNGIIAEEQYAQDREEIERRLLEDTATARSKQSAAAPISARNTAYLLGIGLPLVAIVFYMKIGEPDRITNPAPVGAPPAATSAAPPERTQEQIEANVTKLAQRLESNPNDPQGWTMLARSYSSMEKYSEATKAYAKATELNPKEADLWAEYAFVTGMAEGRSLEGKPMELINRALKVDPENLKALQLAGSAAFQAKDYNKAVDYWQRVLKKVPAGSEVAETITARINEAKTLAASK
ncbi:MAG TPA: c-type cytochrome biogenesis protein CcmI [Pyrinomonadaceae bacterium]|nr:c-type cytochrome biogenesis protein CcmI [Pyrinomonadaceae bacterium]